MWLDLDRVIQTHTHTHTNKIQLSTKMWYVGIELYVKKKFIFIFLFLNFFWIFFLKLPRCCVMAYFIIKLCLSYTQKQIYFFFVTKIHSHTLPHSISHIHTLTKQTPSVYSFFFFFFYFIFFFFFFKSNPTPPLYHFFPQSSQCLYL